ncbi:MAG TPA: lipid-A-disaccharide synthase N-terminal domain-containing protein [Cyclobacteriaceae bacterium]|nr:lipid-A-disaccharide synthase N-terminal domain-containing protein [Cyclobacteriaceae bacterium]HRJ82699.1 lipid-A-disaccharide synthase N-terminal domain-containing protein [Cyclobacteriaceae bacterium]
MSLNQYLIYGLGFFAQALFGSRMIVQWISSERAGKVMSPTIFWQTSLLASFLFMIYGLLRYDVVIVAGQLLSYYIYIRNLQLKESWLTIPVSLRLIFLLSPVVTVVWIGFFNHSMLTQLELQNDFTQPFMLVGAAGQLILNLRFIYQWYYSEKRHISVLPGGFWILSLLGSVLVIGYAVYRQDPVLLLAQSLGLIVYVRNIFLGLKKSD